MAIVGADALVEIGGVITVPNAMTVGTTLTVTGDTTCSGNLLVQGAITCDATGVDNIINVNKQTATNRALFDCVDASIGREWQMMYRSTGDFALGRYVAGAFQDYCFIADNTNGNLTLTADLDVGGDLALTGASPTSELGDGTGGPALNVRKSDAGTYSKRYQVGSTNMWIEQFNPSEDLAMLRRTAAGAAEDTAVRIDWSDGNVHIANDLVLAGDGSHGSGALDLAGNFGCNGVASAAPQAYTRAATIVETRALLANASATAANNNAVIAQLLEDLAAIGLITVS